MFMARISERLSAEAFTRASVEAYLRAVAEERTRLELAIAEEHSRREVAEQLLGRLDAAAPDGRPSVDDGCPDRRVASGE